MIVINGGGIIGSYLASKLDARQEEVHVLEEHADNHKTCSALVTSAFSEQIPKKLVLNTIFDTRIYAPDGKSLHIHFRQPDITFQREEYIAYLQAIAENKGGIFHRNVKLRSITTERIRAEHLADGKTLSLHPMTLIGADGALSAVGRLIGMVDKRPHFVGYKALARMKHDNTICFYPYLKDFAWTIPIDEDTVEVGAAARTHVGTTFEKLCTLLNLRPEEKEAAVIPIYNPRQQFVKKLRHMHVALVGDAAGHVKATTGGGIVYGCKAADVLAQCIAQHKMNAYQQRTRDVAQELNLHLRMRRMLDKMTPGDWNTLIRHCNDPGIKDSLSNISRDHLSKLVVQSVWRKPQLLQFIRLLV